MTTELHALLWSKRGNCFHIEPLSATAKSGRRFFSECKTNDYLLIFFGSVDACGVEADSLRSVLIEREEVRRLYGAE